MRALALAALALLAGAAPARGYAPLGYPGSTWGYAGRDLDGIDGNATQGHLTQGVDWLRLPRGWTLETFGGYAWRLRSRNRTYFDAHSPYAGAMVYRGGLSAGADYVWHRYPSLNETTGQPSLFAAWYARRPLRAAGRTAPLSSWGRLFCDLNGREGCGSMGWVQQGVDWFTLPGGVTFDTYAALRWRLRSKNETHYDAFGPALGVDLVRGPVDLSLEYAWRRYPSLEDWSAGPQVALTWYFDWELKPFEAGTEKRRSAWLTD